jgi:hypothetical protein
MANLVSIEQEFLVLGSCLATRLSSHHQYILDLSILSVISMRNTQVILCLHNNNFDVLCIYLDASLLMPAESHKSSSISIIIEVAVGGSILLLVLLLAGVYAFHSKKRVERAIKRTKPFGELSFCIDLANQMGYVELFI